MKVGIFDSKKSDQAWVSTELPKCITSQEIGEKYNQWADTYNDTVSEWDYRSPRQVAQLVHTHRSLEGKFLDAGCGTGLSGRALRELGVQPLTGIDISPASLKLAEQTQVYSQLEQLDMMQLPLPFDRDEFVGVSCVGVMSYLPNTEDILREFCRLVCRDGLIVFTQREDVFANRNCLKIIATLEQEGLWDKILISDPELYMPNNKDFKDEFKVINSVLQVKA